SRPRDQHAAPSAAYPGTADPSLESALPIPARLREPGDMTDQKIILITGANKGIGFATARVLGRAGHVVLVGARDPERGTTAASELTGEGSAPRFARLDAPAPAPAEAAAACIDAEPGRLDILINNAGISRDRHQGTNELHQPSETAVAAVREVYETNVLGVI